MYDVVVPLAWGQHGAFSTEQVTARGVTRNWLYRHRQRGFLVRRAPRVYALADAPASARQELMVHILAAGSGARATGDSGLGLWCPELPLPRVPVVAVPRSCGYRTSSAVIHRSTDLHLANGGCVDGIPVVGVARALLDAAHGRSCDEALQRIDACRRHLPLAVGALTETLHAHARPGRPGIAVFREALRSLRSEVTDSEFERLVLRDLGASGVPEPKLHHVVRLPGQNVFELDLAWPVEHLDVELDGADHLDRVRKARGDRRRDRLLQANGWTVLRYTWADYVADGPQMIAEIEAVLRGLRRRGR